MKKNRAFTLFEILSVIIIIGIVLALAAPDFSKGYAVFKLNKAADDLLGVSRWAQAMAIGQQRIYAISFSDDRRSWALVRAQVNEETGEQSGFEPVRGVLGRPHVVGESVRIDTDANPVEFYPDGTIDSATIQLNSSGHKTVLSSLGVRGMMTKTTGE